MWCNYSRDVRSSAGQAGGQEPGARSQGPELGLQMHPAGLYSDVIMRLQVEAGDHSRKYTELIQWLLLHLYPDLEEDTHRILGPARGLIALVFIIVIYFSRNVETIKTHVYPLALQSHFSFLFFTLNKTEPILATVCAHTDFYKKFIVCSCFLLTSLCMTHTFPKGNMHSHLTSTDSLGFEFQRVHLLPVSHTTICVSSPILSLLNFSEWL